MIVCPSLKPKSNLGPESKALAFCSNSSSCFNHLKQKQKNTSLERIFSTGIFSLNHQESPTIEISHLLACRKARQTLWNSLKRNTLRFWLIASFCCCVKLFITVNNWFISSDRCWDIYISTCNVLWKICWHIHGLISWTGRPDVCHVTAHKVTQAAQDFIWLTIHIILKRSDSWHKLLLHNDQRPVFFKVLQKKPVSSHKGLLLPILLKSLHLVIRNSQSKITTELPAQYESSQESHTNSTESIFISLLLIHI